jgi:hypothetical protein
MAAGTSDSPAGTEAGMASAMLRKRAMVALFTVIAKVSASFPPPPSPCQTSLPLSRPRALHLQLYRTARPAKILC